MKTIAPRKTFWILKTLVEGVSAAKLWQKPRRTQAQNHQRLVRGAERFLADLDDRR